ncbi:MAG: PIN domain-containing protein [Candidatus Aenigmatarchaeota archaeon]
MHTGWDFIDIGMDANSLIDCVQDNGSLSSGHLRDEYGNDNLCVSSRAFGEVVKFLQEEKGLSEDEAMDRAHGLLDQHDVTLLDKEDVDDEEGQDLIEKYEDADFELHYPDSTILAHYLRESMDLLLSRDWGLRQAAEAEGLDAEKMPTPTELADRKFESLF